MTRVAVILRHGDRTARTSFPTDPHPVSPSEAAVLTDEGRQRIRRFSRFLSDRYACLLSRDPTILVQSSSQNRCRETAALLVSEMTAAPCDPSLIQERDKMLFNVYPNCSAANRWQEQLYRGSTARAVLSRDAESLQQLQRLTGLPGPLDLEDAHDVWDVLRAHEAQGESTPAWAADPFLRSRLDRLNSGFFCLASADDRLRRLFTRLLLSDLKQRLRGSGKDSPDLLIYSSNDFLLQRLLWLLGSKRKRQSPPFASAIVIEVTEEAGVSVSFIETGDSDGQQAIERLSFPSCVGQSDCSLDAAFADVDSFSEDDFDRECESEPETADLEAAPLLSECL